MQITYANEIFVLKSI